MTPPFIRKDQLPYAVPVKPDIFEYYKQIAERERGTAADVINDVLRKHMEGHG